jgi:glyoxylase-like metal-dependent hydrolase (beta-lactamase superfamily II)
MAEGRPRIQAFFDKATNTITYLVADPATNEAAVIDPVLDYDHAGGVFGTKSAEIILAAAAGYHVTWVLETHVHADHLSAAPFIKARTGAKIGIGRHVAEVRRLFAPTFPAGEGAFDHLFADGEAFTIGKLTGNVLETPGHTPADVSYLIGDAAFVGDTLFMPDYGTARTDFPGGDARMLYQSVQKLLALPPETRIFTCHDYKAPGRADFAWESTVAAQAEGNIHIRRGVTEAEFVAIRQAQDAILSPPALLLPSIQVNLRAGQLPEENANGVRYLMVPIRLGV